MAKLETEYEAKVLDINKAEIEKLLRALGAEFNGRFEQKRYTYNTVDAENQSKWIRLRSNGKKSTLCFKSIETDRIDGTKEIEFEVPDFEQADKFLECIGIPHKQYQENTRTQYHLDGVEIDIDEWPLIPIYLEVEGKNEQEVLETIKRLKLDKHRITSKNTNDVYQMYGIDLTKIKDLRFPK